MSSDPKLPYFSPVTAPPREWRVGDVLRHRTSDIEWYVTNGEGSEKVVRVMTRRGEYATAARLEAKSFDNLGPHRIEPDGNGGLRFVKIEDAPPAPPQPDPIVTLPPPTEEQLSYAAALGRMQRDFYASMGVPMTTLRDEPDRLTRSEVLALLGSGWSSHQDNDLLACLLAIVEDEADILSELKGRRP
jgi:hypothetical protein